MKRYRVQLLCQVAGVHSGRPGDILEVPADQAHHLAIAGMVIICGDEPGETIDPADVEIDTDVDCPLELTERGERILEQTDAAEHERNLR